MNVIYFLVCDNFYDCSILSVFLVDISDFCPVLKGAAGKKLTLVVIAPIAKFLCE